MFRILCFFACCYSWHGTILSQNQPDSTQTTLLKEVNIKVQRQTISHLPQSQAMYLWSGKKSEVISLQNLDANITEKTPRQIFAKVPGVFVYDMDGSGNQTNISTRGLDPHRGWEFNIRTNGTLNNSDIYGYPASHFSLPMEAIGRIELVRGTGALQYGAQFGGMLNYVLKQPDTTQRIGLELVQSVGSFGLVSTFAAVGGKIGKWQYQAFYNKRVSEGYRDNSRSNYDGEGFLVQYTPHAHWVLKAEVLRSNYIYQIPGPLTDAMFHKNPRQATRSRNYFNPEIWLPSTSVQWQPNNNTRIQWSASAVLGERRSVMFDRLATIRDSINAATGTFNARQVDIDGFRSFTSELRLMQSYAFFGHKSTLVMGVQYFNNDLNRRQLGKGTTGTDFDLAIDPVGWGRDLHLLSKNIAFSTENKFQVTSRWSVSPGFRYEFGDSHMTGKTTYYDPQDLPNSIKRNFPLLGINSEWVVAKKQMVYGGWSQAYRPVIFKDIIPANPYEQADKNLKDAFGFNAELGWRGTYKGLKWDAGAFVLQYNNKLGSLARYDANIDTVVLFRTNIGDARTYGVELFVEYGAPLSEHWFASVFTSTAYFNGEYLGDSLRANSTENRSIKGKKLESVPEWISRNGVTLRYKKLSISALHSYTAATFSDPFNTVTPTANGAVGLTPAYALLDLNATYRVGSVVIRASLNNVANKQYFTKRPTFYPGPGVWPSDGRSVVVSIAVKF